MEILNRVKRCDALQVRAFWGLVFVRGLNIALDVFLPAKSIKELVKSLRRRQLRITQTKRAASCIYGGLAKDKKVVSKGKGSRHVEVALAILLPLGKASDPQIAPKAQLSKAMFVRKILLIAPI